MIVITGLGEEEHVTSPFVWNLSLRCAPELMPAPRCRRRSLPRPLQAGQSLVNGVTSACSWLIAATKNGSSKQERGDPGRLMNIQAVINRARSAFSNAPDLHVSVEQMQRLCGIDRETAEMVLDCLVDTMFLARTSTYTQRSQVDIHAR